MICEIESIWTFVFITFGGGFEPPYRPHRSTASQSMSGSKVLRIISKNKLAQTIKNTQNWIVHPRPSPMCGHAQFTCRRGQVIKKRSIPPQMNKQRRRNRLILCGVNVPCHHARSGRWRSAGPFSSVACQDASALSGALPETVASCMLSSRVVH